MELLDIIGQSNDIIWESFLKLMKPVSDNVWIIVAFTSIIFAFLIAILMIKIMSKQTHEISKIYLFLSVPIYGFVLSIAYMVDRLPMIHGRIQNALSTTASIIMSSDTYSYAFEHASNVTIKTSKSIAEYLYFHVLEGINPAELYEHLYSALDKTRKIPFLKQLNIHQQPLTGDFLFYVFLFIAFVCVIAGFLQIKKRRKKYAIYMITNGFFIIYLMSRNYGAIFSFLLIEFVLHVLIYCFGPAEEKKTIL